MRIELLWFQDCPNHETAHRMIDEVLADLHVDAAVTRIEVPDETVGNRVCFPGSPTVRVDGEDVEPGWEPCEDCTPRCRVYLTPDGLRGLPPRAWLVDAIRRHVPPAAGAA